MIMDFFFIHPLEGGRVKEVGAAGRFLNPHFGKFL
jgi:hypothetical protein